MSRFEARLGGGDGGEPVHPYRSSIVLFSGDGQRGSVDIYVDGRAVGGHPPTYSAALASVEVLGRTGFSLGTGCEVLSADGDGRRHVLIPDLGRVELQLGGVVEAGDLQVDQTLRDLPVGSHLDTTTGTFTWAPAPGYLGTYRLVFKVNGDLVRVEVTIRPPGAPSGVKTL